MDLIAFGDVLDQLIAGLAHPVIGRVGESMGQKQDFHRFIVELRQLISIPE